MYVRSSSKWVVVNRHEFFFIFWLWIQGFISACRASGSTPSLCWHNFVCWWHWKPTLYNSWSCVVGSCGFQQSERPAFVRNSPADDYYDDLVMLNGGWMETWWTAQYIWPAFSLFRCPLRLPRIQNRDTLLWTAGPTTMSSQPMLLTISGHVRTFCRDQWIKYTDCNYARFDCDIFILTVSLVTRSQVF